MYGKCIVADYNSVHKDKCANEFLRLKDCFLVSGITCYHTSDPSLGGLIRDNRKHRKNLDETTTLLPILVESLEDIW
ncbi:hypothetical protein F4819DRAFT_472540 [Hypoxylon fuscum]|nr:hypothetical protein F4819DRAFT_472540 [Hypoxylon fuscum]